MNPKFIRVPVRIFKGLNLLEDSRITDPGSFERLQNIYRKAPGILENRPGSAVFCRSNGYRVAVPTDTPPTSGNTNTGRTATDVRLSSTVISAIFTASNASRAGNTTLGSRGIMPRPRSAPTVQTSASRIDLPSATNLDLSITTVSVTPNKVEALHRLYTDHGNRRFLLAALDFTGGDRLAYVDNESTTPVLRMMAVNEMTVGEGSHWQFVDYFFEDEDNSQNNYYAVGTNGVGKPFCVMLDSNNKPVASLLDVVNEGDWEGDGTVLTQTIQRLFAVQSMCVYNGSIIYGGFKMVADDGSDFEDKSNYICFSQPGEPHKIAQTDGEISDIRIGDTKYEPVTFVTVNSVKTDAQGIKGQLVVFTTKRVVTYDGLPPVSGNASGTAFHSVTLNEVGCVAYKTIQQTPAGLCFLGTDGVVYMIPKYSAGGPVPISRAVEPVFKHLSLRQQKNCAAVYDDGHYKISIPEVNYTGNRTFATHENLYTPFGNQGATVPNVQYWVDLREPPMSTEIDFGYVWSGPHTGMKHSCFVKGSGYEDNNILWAGSAVDGTIFQASIEGLASDPSPTSPTTIVPLTYDIRTGQFDAGDIHIDKSVKVLKYGANVDRSVDIVSRIIVSGEVANTTSESFTDTITPVGTVMDGATTLANFKFADYRSYRFKSKSPTSTKRGRTFSFRWTATPSSATQLKLSDLEFIFERHEENIGS